MHKSVVLLALAVACACTVRAGEPPSFVEGEVLVRFRRTETMATARRIAGTHGGVVARQYARLSSRQGRPVMHLRAKGKSTARLLAELRRDPAVELAEPNYIRPLLGTAVIPNDAEFPSLWALRNTGQAGGTPGADIRATQAWAMLPSSTADVVIAIIDTGIDGGHPDLTSNLWINAGENPTNGIDDDSNGYIDDYYGYDFAGPGPDPFDSGRHGTRVAGIAAATGQNGIGIIGAAWHARLMSLRVSSTGTGLDNAAELEAIEYAVMMKERGVNVVAINASYGDVTYSALEHDAIQLAADAGIVFCAACGNSMVNDDITPLYPACYDISNIIAVAATDQSDQLVWFSSYGPTTVALAAPGNGILSALPVSLGSRTINVTTGVSTYTGEAFQYGGFTTGLTGTVYDCAWGYPGDFPEAVRGNIALIQRGQIDYNVKVTNAMAAGAAAVILYNDQGGAFSNASLHYPAGWIPVVGITQADGQTLVAAGTVTATVVNTMVPGSVYESQNGTSSSAPLVAGAIAAAALCFPDEGMMARIDRVLSAVTPVAALAGKVRTGGRLDMARIIDTNTNSLPDWWETRYFGNLTNPPSADYDEDHMVNGSEWQAGTDPTNTSSYLSVDISADGTEFVSLSWPSVAGHRYAVESSTNLPQGFVSVASNIPATFPTNTTAVPTNSMGFFRISVE